MDFELSEEQRLLQDSVTRLMGDRYRFEARKGFLKQPAGWSADLWAQSAELGLLGLPFAEENGGFGGGPVEITLVMQEFGRALALEPYLATVVLSGAAVRLAGNEAQKSAILPAVAEGRMKLAFSHGRAPGALRSDRRAHDGAADRRRLGARWRQKRRAARRQRRQAGGECAQRRGTRRPHRDHPVPGRCGRLRTGAARLHAARRNPRDRVSLSDVAVTDADVLGSVGKGLPVIERVIEAGIAAMGAEAVGAMETLHAMTLDYSRTREQFGRPIGQNQVVQHRLADMLMSLEQGRSMTMLATMSVEEPDAAERARNISMAKVGYGQAARFVSRPAIQLHGGIGMTEEFAVGHYFRRCMVIEHRFGDTAEHLAKLARGMN